MHLYIYNVYQLIRLITVQCEVISLKIPVSYFFIKIFRFLYWRKYNLFFHNKKKAESYTPENTSTVE
jgi:hypothetical protein